MNDAGGTRGLDALAERVRYELDVFRHNYQPWVPPAPAIDGQPVLDVLIVGGGLYGLGLAWGLMRAKVTNIAVVDRAPAGREGPWVTFARMKTLRTAKELTGIEFGIPSLSVRAYWEARFGAAAWAALDRIPRVEWMDYLDWFRAMTEIPVRNETEVIAIDGDAAMARVTVSRDGATETLHARRVILATGLLGSGGPHVPEGLTDGLPRERWAHSSDPVDFTRLRGADVGVLGAGASAFDNAITAAETGAAGAWLFCRRPELPWLSVKKGLENAGFMPHFFDFPDLQRWRFVKAITETPIPPPRHTVERALEIDNFQLRLGSPWTATRMDGDKVVVTTPSGEHRLDFLIFGTGFNVDVARQPEMAALAPHFLRWRDRFTPPAGEESAVLADQPYLAPGGEFQERQPGDCPVLNRIAMFGFAATLSIGPMFGGLNGVKFVLERYVDATCRALMLKTLDVFSDRFAEGLKAEKPPGALGSTD
ncbi:MAG: NAD(P)-binding domain-containing protein [Rhodospirillaceae bacterium]